MIDEQADHKLSVIVPAHRQGKTIVKDIKRIEKVLSLIRYPFEIIIVVDGRGDGTYRNAKKIKSKKVKVDGYRKNQGKGHAVRHGMKRAEGDYVAFIDSGMEIDPNGISMLLEHMQWYNADVIVGSKRHPVSVVDYPFSRRILSFGYQLLIRLFFRLNVKDTQAGLKIYKKKVLEKILPRLLVKKYAFDLEMLAVARKCGFKRIYEAPIKLNYNFSDLTHASTLRTVVRIFIDTLAIFYRLHIIKYYDGKNWRKWKKA